MWAFQFSGAKIATEKLGPATVVFVTMALSTLLLLPFLRIEKWRGVPMRGRWPARFLVLGAGAVISQLGMTWGIERSLASNAAVLNLTIPVLTALLASAMLNEKMTPLRWLSFGLAIGGVALVSARDLHSADLLHSRYTLGNLLIFAGCCGSAFYNTYCKRVMEAFGPVQVLVYSFFAASAILAPVAILVDHPSAAGFRHLGWPAWSSLLTIAVFSISLSMLLFLWVIDKIDVTQASLSIYLLPVFGVLISAVTLGERLTWELVAGGALVFVSTFLVTIYEERQKNLRSAVPAASR